MPSRSLPRTAGRAALATLAAVGLLLLPQATDRADDPVELSGDGQTTGNAGALGSREGAAGTALDRLDDARGVQLFVAHVRDSSGRDSRNRAAATARRSGLGADDPLPAVATGDRRYATSVDQDSRLTDAQLRNMPTTAIVPALRQHDRAGAADGYRTLLAGQRVPSPRITPGPHDPGARAGPVAGDLVLPLVLAGGVGALAAYAYTRRKWRATTRTTPHGGERAPPPTPLTALDAETRGLLVRTDDAIRTSAEELGFVTAQFGAEAVAPFAAAVRYATAELAAAFRLRQRLDDAPQQGPHHASPADDATRRRMLIEIADRCTEANRRLDSESDAFDRLRALEDHAPDALGYAEAEFTRVGARAATAAATLTALAARYADAASAPVSGHVDEARERLAFAAARLTATRTCVTAGDNGRAAVQLRAAEGAINQAGTLVDAVDRLAKEIAEAAGKLPGALTGTETDLAEARGLLKGAPAGTATAGLQGRIARAESAVHDVRTEPEAGRFDPIDALRRVTESDAALHEALGGAREREVADRRARTLLGRATLTARSAVGTAADFVSTHRGAVGSAARTRLAAAQRHLTQAESPAASDASGALTAARRADALAQESRRLAEQDVRSYESPYGGGGTGGTGGAVLGGIILGELFGGERSRGGGFDGGGFGRGGPGSFGGVRTWGRRGGGRF